MIIPRLTFTITSVFFKELRFRSLFIVQMFFLVSFQNKVIVCFNRNKFFRVEGSNVENMHN